MEGLEITIRPLVQVASEHLFLRLDSEHCQKQFVANLSLIQAFKTGWSPLGEELEELTGGATPLGADYPENGVRFLRVQNIMPNFIDDADMAFISEDDDRALSRSRLQTNDVLLTITGVSYGKAAVVMPEFAGSNINQHSVRMKLKQTSFLRPVFLATFLNATPGKLQSDQNITGVTRPALDYTTIRCFSVPRVSEGLQYAVERVVLSAHDSFEEAKRFQSVAEQTLLQALGLKNWQPPGPLTYTRNASEALTAERFDSEYFAPRVEQLLSKLRADGLTIRDVAPARHDAFDAAKHTGETFDYIEISGLRNDGTATSEATPSEEAPSRASQLVRNGDIITSTVRPIRRLSAIIAPEQDGHVCSSGFVVLKPESIAPEVLLTYLRLPVICELMDLHTSASLYPAISERDLLRLPIPKIAYKVATHIISQVRQAHAARQEAQALLSKAKRSVEVAIEEGEAKAMKFLAY